MDSSQDVWVSREEYRRWAEQQPKGRFERVDGRIIRIAAERICHVRVKASVWMALRQGILAAGLPCEALPDGVTVEVGESDYEPDAVVNCGPRLDDEAIAVPNPVVVVEVLSPLTQGTDTGAKLAEYFRLPSVSHYLIVHPTKRSVIHHRRGEGDRIETAVVTSGAIRLDPPGLTVSMDAFYVVE